MAPKTIEDLVKDYGRVRRTLEEMLKKQKALEQSIECLKWEADGFYPTTIQFERIRSDVENHIKSARAILDICLSPSVSAFIPTANSTRAAIKVFGTAELAEMIFIHLLPMDLLRVQQVNTTMRDLIQTSSKLQRKMFLISDEKANFEILTLDRGVTTEICSLSTNSAGEQNIWVYLDTKEVFPRLGSRAAQMQLCQPRLEEMQIEFSCCRYSSYRLPYNDDHIRYSEVRNRSGITLGDLYEVLEEAKDKHGLCPLAQYVDDHDENGFLWPKVILSGCVQLGANDPLRLRKLQAKSSSEKDKEARSEHDSRIRAYLSAKRAASAANLPIPTLAQYEASLSMV